MTNRKPLFIFEMANNHMGSVEHGLRILQETAAVTRSFGAASTWDSSSNTGTSIPLSTAGFGIAPTSSMSRDSRKRAWRKATFYGFMRKRSPLVSFQSVRHSMRPP